MQTPDARILVDCGLFQGFKVLRERNRMPFPVAPESIDAVIVSHAHLDHTGYLPALVRDGFDGPIYATEGTVELSRLLLPDSAHLLEEEARHAKKHGWSAHERPTPLYTQHDAERALSHFRALPFDERRPVAGGVQMTLRTAGHILGAAGIALDVGETRLRFTGDLGRVDDPLMQPPAPLEDADMLVTESTYGDRHHEQSDPGIMLGDIIRRTAKRNGVVLIPAFAVGRTETVLLHLSRLHDRGEIPGIPIYVNSPMAVSAIEAYRRHEEEHRLDALELDRMYRLPTLISSVDDSKLLNLRGGPMVIISASGMLTGGRILHHLSAYGPDPNNAIVITGYQAGGTRGAALLAGDRTLRIYGTDIQIRAHVHHIESMSAHADADQLINWMRPAGQPRAVFVTHGEPRAADTLRARIKRELHWPARVPEHMETVAW
nr:MBL fold metallo-hydrolase [Microbacterium sp. TNHR37B]